MTIGVIRQSIRDRLRAAGIESAEYETGILMERFLHITRDEYLLEPGKEVGEEAAEKVLAAAGQRAGRLPLQQITGEAPFMGYSFYVNEDVLIPRMDTECLVEEAVREIRETLEQRSESESEPEPESESKPESEPKPESKPEKESKSGPEPVRVLDLCTGSGCIGISVKLLCPRAWVYLSDLSERALDVARRNAERLGASVEISQGDLFEPVEGRFDYILSNPPYIPSGDIEGLMPEVRDHEPMMALDGCEDGLVFYRRIIDACPRYLKPGGSLIFEIGAWQGEDVEKLLQDAGFSAIKTLQDLAGLDRVVRADLAEGARPDLAEGVRADLTILHDDER